jgi:hypothetical protein
MNELKMVCGTKESAGRKRKNAGGKKKRTALKAARISGLD